MLLLSDHAKHNPATRRFPFIIHDRGTELASSQGVKDAMTMKTGNVFADVADRLDDEQVMELLSTVDVRIERIVSTGHASPPGFWYDQDRAEWVILLAGSAGLLFEGEAVPRPLKPGDYVHIGAHRRHRIAWTDRTQPTVWLAIHHR